MARSKNPFQTSEAVDNIGIESSVATISEPNIEVANEVLADVLLPKTKTKAAETTAVPVEFMTQLLAMFAEKMNEGLSKVLEAARTAPIDPIKEKQRERAEKTKKETEEAYWKQLKHKAETCSHLREDGSSNVAWAMQSDSVLRGVCQRCNCLFSPRANECVSPAIHAAYKDTLRIPDRARSSVVYVG